MGTIVALIMVILFILLMLFVFSTALLTPLIGKKNLLFVVSIGFIVGIIGGVFLIGPVFEDIPAMAASFHPSTSKEIETINVDISTDMDINQFVNNAKQIEGVKSVEVKGITVKTSPLSDKWKAALPRRIPASNREINSAQILPNNTIKIEIQNQSDPKDVIKKLEDWLMLVGEIDLRFGLAHASFQVESVRVYDVSNQLSKDAVVTGIQGPRQDRINYIKSITPDKSSVVIFCGIIGMLVGLVGLFIDTLLGFFDRLKEIVRK
ncbi:MAG: hypothetical protein PQ964_00490 [Methanobacteriaceae archaeon]|jgi:hypothetical protein